MLPKCPYNLKVNVPLVNYEGKILAVSNRSQICAFDAPTSSWKEESGPQHQVNNTIYTVANIIHMAVNHDTLRVYAKNQWSKMAIFTLTTKGWKDIEFDVNQSASNLLLTPQYLFETIGESIYSQKINKSSESDIESVEALSHPKR